MMAAVNARERHIALFKAFAGNGAAGSPAWLRELRGQAIARFAELGFPSTKQEEWRFTSVAAIAETTFALSHGLDAPGVTASALAPYWIAGPGAIRLVFVNGTFAPALSAAAELPRGVRAGSLRAALASDAELAQRHLARHADYQTSPFAALNTAFLSDGAFVYVPAGVELERPIEVVFAVATDGEREALVAHPRTLVIVERGARATVLESYVAPQGGVYWTNAVTEIALAQGARLEHYRIQRESREAYQVATTHATQDRDTVLRLHPVALGAALARHDLRTELAGTGGELILNGLYLLRGRQHFNGRIIVRPGAQRTDSKQTNNNLLLSADARADSQPQLEIYADDVKCTHGSTVGPLDETALYYLRSRGLAAETAAGMLTYGFAAEILGRMEHAAVRDELDRVIRGRLADRTRGGRRGAT